MRILYLPCISASLISLSACSIHPIPYDVPGFRTVDIVKKIRCEAAKAIDRHVVQPMKDNPKRLNKYLRTAIAYRFTFTITESNNAGANAGFRLPFSHGTFTLGIGGAAERERSGTRDLTISDTFAETLDEIYVVEDVARVRLKDAIVFQQHLAIGPGPLILPSFNLSKKKLVHLTRPKECAQEAKGENWIYPITGTIGLDETIRTFVELDRLHLLDPKEEGYEVEVVVPPASPSKAVKKLHRFSTSSQPTIVIINEKVAVVVPTKATDRRWKRGGGGRGGDEGGGDEGGDDAGDKPEGEAKTKGFSDQLMFTTTLKASAKPAVELKSVGSGLRLADADASLSGERVDKHKVNVTITPAKNDEPLTGLRIRNTDESDKNHQDQQRNELITVFGKR